MNPTRVRILNVVLKLMPHERRRGVHVNADWYNLDPYVYAYGGNGIGIRVRGVLPCYLNVYLHRILSAGPYGTGLYLLDVDCNWRDSNYESPP